MNFRGSCRDWSTSKRMHPGSVRTSLTYERNISAVSCSRPVFTVICTVRQIIGAPRVIHSTAKDISNTVHTEYRERGVLLGFPNPIRIINFADTVVPDS